jgi:hypothetical protein
MHFYLFVPTFEKYDEKLDAENCSSIENGFCSKKNTTAAFTTATTLPLKAIGLKTVLK